MKKVKAGETFELAYIVWKVLEVTDQGYKCLAEKLEGYQEFDKKQNNWEESDLRKYLNEEFLEKLEAATGKENIIQFERNLTSLDGQTEYGTCKDKVSLLDIDEYRRYRSLIPNTGDYWWWLITPWSTPCNEFYYGVTVVSPGGIIYWGSFNGLRRPRCPPILYLFLCYL